MKVTPKMRAALRLLLDKGPMNPRLFAAQRWPEKFHSSLSSCGRKRSGAIRGVGCTMMAGRFLRRLAKEGLLFTRYGSTETKRTVLQYGVSDRGREALLLAEERARKYGQPGQRRLTA